MKKLARLMRNRQNQRDMSLIFGSIMIFASIPLAFTAIGLWNTTLSVIAFIVLLIGCGAYTRGV